MKDETEQIVQELRISVPELFQDMDSFNEQILYFNVEEMLRWKRDDKMSIIPGNVFYTVFDELSDDQYEQFLLFESVFVEYIGAKYESTKTYRDILTEIKKIYEDENVSWEEANEIYFEHTEKTVVE